MIRIQLFISSWILLHGTYALIICFPLVQSSEVSHQEPRGGTILLFFFPVGKGSLVLETTSMDHGDILARFVRGRQGEKCFTWYPGRRVKMIKKIAKNGIHLFVIFANEKEILYFDLTIKG